MNKLRGEWRDMEIRTEKRIQFIYLKKREIKVFKNKQKSERKDQKRTHTVADFNSFNILKYAQV